MTATECTLCGLATPDPPLTGADVEGSYCCRGCLAVARTLDDPAAAAPPDGSSGDDPDADPWAAAERTAFLAVDGMHCVACEAFLESRATDLDGVHAAAASYPTGTLKIGYDPGRVDRAALPGAIGGLGYRVREPDAPRPDDDGRTGRIVVGGFFGMMAMVWYVLFLYPLYLGVDPSLLLVDLDGVAGRYLLWNVWLAATVVLGYAGLPLLRGAVVSLSARRPNVDLLVATAATTAYAYSTLVLLRGGTEVYFDVTVVVVLAVTVGAHYEARVRRAAAGRLSALTDERVDEARRRTADGTGTVPLAALEPGEEVIVRAGERIPVDGTAIEGAAAVDASLVTGESRPVRTTPGDAAVGGARLASGELVVRVGADATSTLDRLLDVLRNVRSGRSGVRRLADRLAAAFVPLVVALAVGAAGWRLATGAPPDAALLTGLSVLVVSCPCALGLATPLAVTAGLRTALDRGIVVTEASAFERAPDAATVAFDKTGTLTTGEMRVVDVVGGRPVRRRAAAVERLADHPVASAIAGLAGTASTDVAVSGFERYPGRGVGADVDGERVLVGRPALFADRGWTVPDRLADRCRAAREAGTVPSLVGWDGRAEGAVVCGDTPRPGWERVVDEFGAGRRVVVISGDREPAVDRFRAHPAVDEAFAGVPPAGKAELVDRLRRDGPVFMVGDGSNDAPALAAADVGVSLARGTRLAADAADAVVVDDDLAAVPGVVDVTAATRRRVRENLAWAFCYNAVALPAAVAGLLSPLVAAAAMAASSLLVVANSARPLGVDDGGPRPSAAADADADAAGDAAPA